MRGALLRRRPAYAILASIGLVLTATAASAQALHGRWALQQGACDGEAFTRRETPLLVERLAVRWFNADCTVVSSYRVKDVWYLQGRCAVESRISTIPLMLDLQGDRLRVGWDREPVIEMERCRSSPWGELLPTRP